jgi:hypothetical protein
VKITTFFIEFSFIAILYPFLKEGIMPTREFKGRPKHSQKKDNIKRKIRTKRVMIKRKGL